MIESMCLIEYRGLYYRPDSKGYTGFKDDAGRYSFEEAAAIAGLNDPNGRHPELTVWTEDYAPEFSPACYTHLKLDRVINERDRLRAELAAATEREIKTATAHVKDSAMELAKARNQALEEAAQEVMRENERRLALASIRVPAMAEEIATAIRALKDRADNG